MVESLTEVARPHLINARIDFIYCIIAASVRGALRIAV
jgi:hypothetical protein